MEVDLGPYIFVANLHYGLNVGSLTIGLGAALVSAPCHGVPFPLSGLSSWAVVGEDVPYTLKRGWMSHCL